MMTRVAVRQVPSHAAHMPFPPFTTGTSLEPALLAEFFLNGSERGEGIVAEYHCDCSKYGSIESDARYIDFLRIAIDIGTFHQERGNAAVGASKKSGPPVYEAPTGQGADDEV